MQTRETAQGKILQLVERFEEQKDFYRRSEYNETLTRQDFINPFFKALGWDIDNENGYAESYREVIHEDRLKVGKSLKAPDYAFRLVGGKRLFFVEAKKPSVLIRDEATPAYQVRRYGWNAKMPISIITDFEEFAIYDCTRKPAVNDKASTARLKYFTYTDYLGNFDFIWDTFSKEKVLKGSFDKFVQSDTYKKGTATVDKDFLQSLDRWRLQLATTISRNNRQLDGDEINYVVQQTIDRIIFLRIAEDRSVEPYGTLKDCIKQGNLYQNLFKLFGHADAKYNSGLFDFKKDTLSGQLEVENKVVKAIINELYYPECPYEFAYLPVEILGTAYEQFLGKQIKIDASHKATIEEKPEVRKAGGVYYTPQYIVDYIVESTVGKLIAGKTPKEIRNLKIVDPACGSGSFLLGAYQYLLDYHKHYYSNNGKPAKGNKHDTLTPDGNLTTAEKKRILLGNIYGVDIDVNAVEVTKLSLLLKCMEGETAASIASQMKLFHERVLPTLDNNIKDGNSLIDTDFYSNEMDLEFDKKIKPFSWQKTFPEVFSTGGFDAVIGNPPYVQPNILDEGSRAYLKSAYEANTDLYSIFIEKSISLLSNGGQFGFIVPSLFIRGIKYDKLRGIINSCATTATVKEYGDGVFERVKMPTCVILLTKGKPKQAQNYFENDSLKLFAKVKTIPLGDISETRRGLEIGRDKLFESGDVKCITGGNLDIYRVKGIGFITADTYNLFAKDKDMFSAPKIMVRETGNRFFATLDYNGIITTRSIYSIKIKNNKYPAELVLGILNSKLFQYYHKKLVAADTKVFPKLRIAQLKEIPIPKGVDENYIAAVTKHVNQIMTLYKELESINLHSKIEKAKSQIEHYEAAIDNIVYGMYGITEDDKKEVDVSLVEL